MLDIKYIREHPDEVIDSIRRRGMGPIDIDKLLKLNQECTQLGIERDQVRRDHNLIVSQNKAPSQEEVEKGRELREKSAKIDKLWTEKSLELSQITEQIPNLIAESTPDGDESSNLEMRKWGVTDKPDFDVKDHLQLNEIHHFVNFEAAAKTSGNKFYFLQDKGVRLWLALLAFSTQFARDNGYSLMMVPHMVNTATAAGTGYLPRGEEKQIYSINETDLNLIATAEMPLTGFYSEQTIDVTQPIYLAGLSTCYRVEAGAYGKFSKGLYRVHQFDKLELYVFTSAKQSNEQLQKLINVQEQLYQALNIPYRLIRIAAGDLSAAAFEKYDLEYWSPAENTYRELTSTSNCTDYQARRLQIRYKNTEGKSEYVHTINGTGVTSTRTLIAILENYQQADGSVKIPEVLQSYYGGETL